MIFSKSYCPYCENTKKIFSSNYAEVSPHIIEMDIVEGGAAMQSALQSMSGQRTVPNVYIGGKHIGGNDDTEVAHQSGELRTMLQG